MNEKTIRALVEAGAVKRVHIVAEGSLFHVDIDTPAGSTTACTMKGRAKTWVSLDSAAKWVRGLGMGKAEVHVESWTPTQRAMELR